MPAARTRADVAANSGQPAPGLPAVLGNSLLGPKIVGYLDRVSRLRFREATKLAYIAVKTYQLQMEGLLNVSAVDKLSPEDRTNLFNYQLARHRCQDARTQELVKLGEGKEEIEALRAEYGERPAAQKKMPFVHWCMDRALKQRDARPLQLVLCLPDTDVNAMYVDDSNDAFSALQTLAFYHDEPNQQDLVGDLAATLLSHPAIDVNARTVEAGYQDTALLKAMRSPNPAVIKALATHPALDWNAQNDYFGSTALHVAARHFSHDKLNLLMPYIKLGKLDINIQNASGNTPLHAAVVQPDNPENVRLLLEAGADPTIRNKQGCTPYEEAKARNNHKAQAILESFNPPEPGSWQDVLGVARNERGYKTVREAYVARARAAHPDKGGTAEAFQKVQLAWKAAEPLLQKSA